MQVNTAKKANKRNCFVKFAKAGLKRLISPKEQNSVLISLSQERSRRQHSDRFEGDILIGSAGSSPDKVDAAIADPDKMWPGGNVEYTFYKAITR